MRQCVAHLAFNGRGINPRPYFPSSFIQRPTDLRNYQIARKLRLQCGQPP